MRFGSGAAPNTTSSGWWQLVEQARLFACRVGGAGLRATSPNTNQHTNFLNCFRFPAHAHAVCKNGIANTCTTYLTPSLQQVVSHPATRMSTSMMRCLTSSCSCYFNIFSYQNVQHTRTALMALAQKGQNNYCARKAPNRLAALPPANDFPINTSKHNTIACNEVLMIFFDCNITRKVYSWQMMGYLQAHTHQPNIHCKLHTQAFVGIQRFEWLSISNREKF